MNNLEEMDKFLERYINKYILCIEYFFKYHPKCHKIKQHLTHGVFMLSVLCRKISKICELFSGR